MLLYGRIVIPINYPFSKDRNSEAFTHSDFKMAHSFAIIGSITTTAFKFMSNVRTL